MILAQRSLAALPSIAARAQLATVFLFSSVFLGETELCQRGITIGLQTPHPFRICLQCPNDHKEPHMTDAPIVGPMNGAEANSLERAGAYR